MHFVVVDAEGNFINSRTRKFLVQAASAYNVTDTTEIQRGSTNYQGWPFADGKFCRATGNFFVPSDYVSGLTISGVVVPAANGDIADYLAESHGKDGEAWNTHTADTGALTTAVVSGEINKLTALTAATVEAGDYFSLEFVRQANLAGDTINAQVNFMGFLISYRAGS